MGVHTARLFLPLVGSDLGEESWWRNVDAPDPARFEGELSAKRMGPTLPGDRATEVRRPTGHLNERQDSQLRMAQVLHLPPRCNPGIVAWLPARR